jgi:hypothetical protein
MPPPCPKCGHVDARPDPNACKLDAMVGLERSLFYARAARKALLQARLHVAAHALDGQIDSAKAAIELLRGL